MKLKTIISSSIILFVTGSLVAVTQVAGLFPRSSARETPASEQVGPTGGPIQNVRFTLSNDSIYPRRLRARPGRIAIAIEDRTRRSLGLIVQRQTEVETLPVGQVTLPANVFRARAQFGLGVGRYVVFDASQPNNRAELLVEPQ